MSNLPVLNPWWKGKAYLREDKHLKEFEEKEYKWFPDLLNTLKLKPKNIFTLRGPRQVGKTTLAKLLIKRLIDEGINEKDVFYWNCDELVDFRELSAILREYLEFSRENKHMETYIFLDEVSRVKDWQRSIKSLKDSGELDNACILVTGSNTLDVKYGFERLPGRTGRIGRDLLLLPMSFSDYVKLIKPEIAGRIKKIRRLSIVDINRSVRSAYAYDAEIGLLFRQYLVTGGFPLVINELLSNKKIPDYVYELYFRWVIGDIVKWGKREKILVQLLKSVMAKQCSPISWDSLAKESEIRSHKTVSAYVEDLENMFVLITLYFLELNKKLPDAAKNKKIYFHDPFIYHVFNRRIYFEENDITPCLIESAAISNLARLSYDGFIPQIYYWKNKREVDAVVKIKKDVFPFEIKYQSRISKQDYRGLYYFNKGVLITKDSLKLGEKYSEVPAHIMLAVI